jgi:hypothetical protein
MFEMTMAQACGEQPFSEVAWVPGVDFDPSDPDDVEAVLEASERHLSERMDRLERENALLRSMLEGGE